jgi:hypothetical protein
MGSGLPPGSWRVIGLWDKLTGVKMKIRRIAESLAAAISQWENVEAVLLGEAADLEVFDPFFTVDLDVYIQGPVPVAEERKERLAEKASFEGSTTAGVDRLRVEELTVSVHYMETSHIDSLMRRILDSSWVFHEPGTNMFYRIEKGEVLYSRGGWFASIRASHAEIPDDFWTHICMRAFTIVEKALSELGAAAFRSDDLFFLVSAARLLRGVASYLFAVNRQFEPSGRMLYERIKMLPILPDGFIGMLDNFLRPVDGLSFEAKREIATHIVRSIASLGLEPRGTAGLDARNGHGAEHAGRESHSKGTRKK